MTAVEFYYNDVCPFAYRVRLALAEKSIPHQARVIDLRNIPDWYARISPTGKVPLLKYGDDVVWESTVINEFLEDAFPDPPLLPREPVARAHARIWIEYCNTTFQPNCCGLVFELDASRHAGIRSALLDSLRTIEAALSQTPGPYWLGDAISLVDLTYYPFFEHMPALTEYRGFRLPEDLPRVHRWLDAMQARPSVQANRRPPEFYVEAYKPYVEGRMGK